MKKILTAVLSLSVIGVCSISAIQASAATADPEGTVIITGADNGGGSNYNIPDNRTYESTFGTFVLDNSDWAVSSLPNAPIDVTTGSASLYGVGEATWTPKPGALSGSYAVYAYNVKRDNTGDTDVTYTVTDDNETQTIHVNQMTDSRTSSGWVYLCTGDFDGANDSVTMKVTTNNVYTHAKDIKFVPVGESIIVASDEKGEFTNGRIGADGWGPSNNTTVIVPSKEITAAITAAGGSGVRNYYNGTTPISFKPSIPKTGKYKVLVWQAYHTDYYSGTPATLKAHVICAENSGNAIEVTGIPYKPVVGQPKWVEVGEYEFNSSVDQTTECVQFAAEGTYTDVRLQAIKLIPIREVAVPVGAGTVVEESVVTATAGEDTATGFIAEITPTTNKTVSEIGLTVKGRDLGTQTITDITGGTAWVQVVIDKVIAAAEDISVYVK